MELYFVNVGYGEAIVLRDGAYTLLIDGGAGRVAPYTVSGTMRLIDFLHAQQITQIDLLIITHLHEDHIGGLVEVVRQLEIGEIWCNAAPSGDFTGFITRMSRGITEKPARMLFYLAIESYIAIRALAEEKNIPFREMAGDHVPHACGPLTLTLLGMSAVKTARNTSALSEMINTTEDALLFKLFDENDCICNQTSLAIQVHAGTFSALLTGDKTGGWDTLKKELDLHAQVLKLTHHGQLDGMPGAMLEGADPEIIVVCADTNHTYHSAHPVVLQRAKDYLVAKGRGPCVFSTGDLSEDPGGHVLRIAWDEALACTKTDVVIYAKQAEAAVEKKG